MYDKDFLKKQHQLNKVMVEMYEKLTAIDIPVAPLRDISIIPKDFYRKSYAGECQAYVNDTFEIAISSDYVLDETGPYNLESAILHELIHTVPGCYEHNEKFLNYCKLVNETYGINPILTTDGFKFAKFPVLLHYKCSCCGNELEFHNPAKKRPKSCWKDEIENHIALECQYCFQPMYSVL